MYAHNLSQYIHAQSGVVDTEDTKAIVSGLYMVNA